MINKHFSFIVVQNSSSLFEVLANIAVSRFHDLWQFIMLRPGIVLDGSVVTGIGGRLRHFLEFLHMKRPLAVNPLWARCTQRLFLIHSGSRIMVYILNDILSIVSIYWWYMFICTLKVSSFLSMNIKKARYIHHIGY